jgi:hypothetical protein
MIGLGSFALKSSIKEEMIQQRFDSIRRCFILIA